MFCVLLYVVFEVLLVDIHYISYSVDAVSLHRVYKCSLCPFVNYVTVASFITENDLIFLSILLEQNLTQTKLRLINIYWCRVTWQIM